MFECSKWELVQNGLGLFVTNVAISNSAFINRRQPVWGSGDSCPACQSRKFRLCESLVYILNTVRRCTRKMFFSPRQVHNPSILTYNAPCSNIS
jgi:hypothetical protein